MTPNAGHFLSGCSWCSVSPPSGLFPEFGKHYSVMTLCTVVTVTEHSFQYSSHIILILHCCKLSFPLSKVVVIYNPLSTHDVTVLNILDWDYLFHPKPLGASAVFPSPPFPFITWFEMTHFPMSVPPVHCIFLWAQPNL